MPVYAIRRTSEPGRTPYFNGAVVNAADAAAARTKAVDLAKGRNNSFANAPDYAVELLADTAHASFQDYLVEGDLVRAGIDRTRGQ